MFKGSHLLLIAGAIILGSAFFFCSKSTSPHKKIQYLPTKVTEEFSNFKVKYGKVYATPEEHHYRLTNFLKTLAKIESHNSGNSGYKMGINKFADLSLDEFRTLHLGLNLPTPLPEAPAPTTTTPKAPTASEVDWRTTAGVVTPVKDQGHCGSCWAFSATGALEGAAALFAQRPGQSFSEQQLVDCSRLYTNLGCEGGIPTSAFMFVHDHGIESEAQYPYQAKDHFTCRSKTGDFKIESFRVVPPGSSGALAAACAERPVSVSIDALKIMSYKEGVFDDPHCGDHLDHAVLLVGYTPDYWIVKNSWGNGWGEEGYIRMSRKATPDAKGGICGILLYASYPTV